LASKDVAAASTKHTVGKDAPSIFEGSRRGHFCYKAQQTLCGVL